MKTEFVTELQHLKIEEDLNDGLEIMDDIFITNNKEFIQFYSMKFPKRSIGELDFNSLRDAETIIYSEQEIDKYEHSFVLLNHMLKFISLFQNITWIIKDNCINYHLGFLNVRKNDGLSTHRNSMSNLFSTSGGQINVSTTFTKNELATAINLVNNQLKFNPSNNQSKATKLRTNSSRLQIAFYQLQVARAQPDVALKIANYCVIMESLLGTSISELTHKLSERTAYLIESDPKNRYKVFNKIKNFYKIRSKILHGNKLKGKDIRKLEELSASCDEIIRRLMNKILHDDDISAVFNLNSNKFTQFMKKLILGFDLKILAKSFNET